MVEQLGRILWADDEIDLLKPYVIFLQQKGYEVVTANSGLDAVEMERQQQFDIVFLDEMMPGMSGLEALSEIKLHNATLPVVLITKNEEERLMDMAVGNKIADYLIKPVNPNQILLTLKKHIHRRELVSEHNNTTYRQEFQDISFVISEAKTLDEFKAIHRTLTRWQMTLQEADEAMRDLLESQKRDADKAFARYVKRNYESWFEKGAERPMLSPDLFKKCIFPLLDQGEKVFFFVIDNFRYDQWKTIEPIIGEYFNFQQEDLYCTILPTATQYARNAIFSGLMPADIKKMYPALWVDEEEEEGKNLEEEQLIQQQMERFRKRYPFTYRKINESSFCEKMIQQLPHFQQQLNVMVVNFIDMLSHSRTDSKMMRELMGDEASYLSLTESWFRHSPINQLLQTIARLGYKLIITTDHGTCRVDNAIRVVGDKNTNVNLRYKVGKSLDYNPKEVIAFTHPERVGLPCPNVSSSYIFATGSDFFAYPNNFNYYVQYYRDTFQHGGVSMDEMLVPLITATPK